MDRPRHVFQDRPHDLLLLKSLKGRGIYANYRDENTGLEYWVSAPKKNGEDRHPLGSGAIKIDEDIADEYWRTIRQCGPPKNPFVT